MRLFIATRIDDDAARQLQEAFQPVRSRTPRASWVAPHAYHLTYAFLGEHDATTAGRLGARFAEAFVSRRRYEGALAGCGFFPNERRPRVGWIGFEEPAPLVEIAGSVRALLDEEGVGFDRKAFRPHLTVVRIRDRWSPAHVRELQHACETAGPVPLVVDRVSLFRSELLPSGARHHEMASAQLD